MKKLKQQGGVKPPQSRRNNKHFDPSLARGARKDFIREVAAAEAANIAEATATEFGVSPQIFEVRKPTVHIQPPCTLEEAKRLRELPHKLAYSCRKLGDRWGKWIDRDRRDGWNHIDPSLETEWNNIVTGLTELDNETRPKILESFIGATGITAIERAWNTKTLDVRADNKTRFFHSYLVRAGAIRQDQGVAFNTFGAIIIVFEHLSGLSENREIGNLYRLMIQGKTEEAGRPLTVREFCGAFGEWLNQPPVRDYFSSRFQPPKI